MSAWSATLVDASRSLSYDLRRTGYCSLCSIGRATKLLIDASGLAKIDCFGPRPSLLFAVVRVPVQCHLGLNLEERIVGLLCSCLKSS